MIATITSKGQLTLPKKLRDELKLHAGDKLDFVIHEDGHIEVIPLKAPVSKLKGLLPKPPQTVSLEAMDRAKFI